MAKYRFCGAARSEIQGLGGRPTYSFSRFGQLIELPDDVAKQAVEGRIRICTPEVFDSVGFTEDELKVFGNFERHVRATAAFREKIFKLWELTAPKPIPVAVEEPVVEASTLEVKVEA